MASTRLAAVLICAACACAVALPPFAGAATITPNTTSDDYDDGTPDPPDANCSLREAVQSAVDNAPFGGCTTGDAGTDVIALTAAPADSYTITVGASDNDNNAEGDFDVGGNGPIVIRGTDHQQIDTIAPDRIIDVKTGADLTLENLIVHGGDMTSAVTDELRGGNIRANSASSLTLNDAIVRFGDAEDGGGIYTGTTNQLRVIDSRIENNGAERNGAGLFAIASGALTVEITRSRIRDNFVNTEDDSVGAMDGGGIWFAGQQMTIADSEISDNHAIHEGTGGSDSATGGGISTAGNTTIRRSLILDNSAEADTAANERGGAIMGESGSEDEPVIVVNSTIAGNVTGDAVGDGLGGAVYIGDDADPEPDVSVFLRHVTFSSNSTQGVTSGDQVQTGTSSDVGTITLASSIIPGFSGLAHNPCAGPNVVSGGFNVAQQDDPDCNFGASDSTGATATGTVGIDPVDNGGFTDSIALLSGGRAVGFVPAAQCANAEGTDQRGYPRPLPVGGACDAGAYELNSCDGATVLNGVYVACPVPTGPSTPTKAKKCKKKKRKKGRGASAAGKKKKKCKRKKKKRN
jgi:hypothetical protein